MKRFPLLLALAAAALPASRPRGADEAGAAPAGGARRVMPASDEAEAAIRQFRIPPGFRVELFAAEPRVANISAFDVDPSGKFYVVEVFRRRGGGVLDLRNLSKEWLEDDLASRTVADRVAMVKRRLTPSEQRAMGVESDRVRLVEDRDGDGRADFDSVFATGFNKLEEGTAAGVMPFDGGVYFANVPNLWLLRDADGDGRADERRVLHSGFGVRYNISGHDFHGLRVGPDGRVYFSVGDRGLHVTGPGGEALVSNPDSGAVLRCEPDGSDLELVHTGLRNPQDLAFDAHGNLFTGDNNSDGGDPTRWVYVVEGGDSGWRVGYQWHDFPASRGPWNHERLWDVKSSIPAAYVVPPVANPDIPGPSGLTYTGGPGLPPEWRDRFLLVDFRGGATNSGVWALQNKPKGAGFELAETKKLVWGALATDVEVGYDGGVYFSDWVDGWVPLGKGRLYRVIHPEAAKDPAVAEARTLLAGGLRDQSIDDLTRLLAHPDMRVRMAAQFKLVEKDAVGPLARVAGADHADRLARLHAVWGLGQLARRPGYKGPAASLVDPLLNSSDEEVRCQAAKVLGEARYARAYIRLSARLLNDTPRVQFFAARALGRLGRGESEAVQEMLGASAQTDPYLRHAGVMALAETGSMRTLALLGQSRHAGQRLAALLALRRMRRTEVASFLDDPEPSIVLEAARAVNDVPIDECTEQLAGLASRTSGVGEGRVRELILTRALNANFRLGSVPAAERLAQFARRDDEPPALRVEALRMLGEWGEPAPRDRITGQWRPRRAGDAKDAADAARPVLPQLLRSAPDAVRAAAAALVPLAGLTDAALLADLVANPTLSADARAAALAALVDQKPQGVAAVVEAALADKDPAVRRAAVFGAAKLPGGLTYLRRVLQSGPTRDRQAAFEALASVQDGQADDLVVHWLDRLIAGSVPPEARLDLLAAAAARESPDVAAKLKQYESRRAGDDPLGPFRETLAGGDASLGRRIFNERADVQCLRCHAVKGEGGAAAGPDLAGIGKKQSREYLLESILFPAKHIAQGWETVTVRLKNGDVVAGVLRSEDDRQLVLADPEKGDVAVAKADVQARRGGQTAMPHDIAQPLSKHDLRNLVEFLASLK